MGCSVFTTLRARWAHGILYEKGSELSAMLQDWHSMDPWLRNYAASAAQKVDTQEPAEGFTVSLELTLFLVDSVAQRLN